MIKIPKLKIDFVSENSPNRPGTISDMKWITIHNTANPNSTAQNERDYVAIRKDRASFHYAVDDREAIAIIPESEIAWHTGTELGNKTSIGIEICESGNQEETYNNALTLIAKILKDRNWGIDKVRTHKSWNGKNCPRRLLAVWDKFLQDIQITLLAIRKLKGKETNDLWKFEGLQYLYERGILHEVEGWANKIEEPMPVWAVSLLLMKLDQNLRKQIK